MPAFLAWPVIKAFFGGWLKAAFAAVASFFRALNAQGWAGLIVCVCLSFATLHFAVDARHWHKQDGRDVKALNAEIANEAKIAKQAVDLKARVDALTSSVTAQIKERSDAESRRIAADAAAVRLRGPGKAVCPGNPGAAGIAIRHDEATPTGADAGSQVSSGDRAAVSWAWLVTVIQEHDELLSKVRATEDQHHALETAWPHSEGAK